MSYKNNPSRKNKTRPPKEILEKEIIIVNKTPMYKLTKKYHVNQSTLERWIKEYEIFTSSLPL
jgi:hypothetical protein